MNRLILVGSTLLCVCILNAAEPLELETHRSTAPHLHLLQNGAVEHIHADPRTWLDHVSDPLRRKDLPTLGSQSCASAACHGGPKPGVVNDLASRSSEFHLWQERDPHALSWRTMCGEKSVKIMQRLKIMDGNQIVDQVAFDNCMACHNSTLRYTETRTSEPIHEGVGCSGCHGASANWVSSHYDWNWSGNYAVDRGFVPLKDLLVRARMCASCHVGDADRDMNHDIIAAGHPVLRYEFTTFHNRLPKHWREAKIDEAQMWLAGQVAAVDSSLKLLQARAADTHSVSTWPEFGAFDCASCHHSLGVGSLLPLQNLSTARFSDWNTIGLEWILKDSLVRGEGDGRDENLLHSLQSLRSTMQGSSSVVNPHQIVQVAMEGRVALDVWLNHGNRQFRNFTSAKLKSALANASTTDNKLFTGWERSTQFYLGAVGARSNWLYDPSTTSSAEQLRNLLSYSNKRSLKNIRYDSADSLELQKKLDSAGRELARYLGASDPGAMPERINIDDIEPMLQKIQSAPANGDDANRLPSLNSTITPPSTKSPKTMSEPSATAKPDAQNDESESKEELKKKLELLQKELQGN